MHAQGLIKLQVLHERGRGSDKFQYYSPSRYSGGKNQPREQEIPVLHNV